MRSKTRPWQMLAGAGVLGVGFLIGCAGEISRPPASTLQEGVNLLDVKEPAWGMAAAYRRGDRVVYMETRVGAMRPEIYRKDAPDDPQNEMDVRFVDAKNRTFWVQRGGDSYVDPTWATDIANSIDAKLPAAERQLDFDMAAEASQKINVMLPPAFKDHAFLFKTFAAKPHPMRDPTMTTALAQMETKYPQPAALPKELQQQVDRGYASYDSYSWTQVYTAKYSGSTGCFAWVCAARHSATAMYVNPNVGYWQLAIIANNHGRGPWDSGMGFDCWSGGGAFSGGVHLSGSNAGNATGNWDGQGGCQTSYNWDSGGWDHLCNDDAAYELWQAKSGSQWTSQGDSISFTWTSNAHFACACQNNSGCDGDWSTPNCP